MPSSCRPRSQFEVILSNEMVSQDDRRRGVSVTIRKYTDADVEQLAALDNSCEMGAAGSESLAFDLLGDPLCRVRHLPTFHMLVSSSSALVKSKGVLMDCHCNNATSRAGPALIDFPAHDFIDF